MLYDKNGDPLYVVTILHCGEDYYDKVEEYTFLSHIKITEGMQEEADSLYLSKLADFRNEKGSVYRKYVKDCKDFHEGKTKKSLEEILATRNQSLETFGSEPLRLDFLVKYFNLIPLESDITIP